MCIVYTDKALWFLSIWSVKNDLILRVFVIYGKFLNSKKGQISLKQVENFILKFSNFYVAI